MVIKASKSVLSEEERKRALAELEALFVKPNKSKKATEEREETKRLNKEFHSKIEAEPERWTPGDLNWNCTQGVTWIQQQVCCCCGGVISAIAGELVEYQHKVSKAVRQVRRTAPLPEGLPIRLQVAQIQVEQCFDCLHLEAKVDEVVEHLVHVNLLEMVKSP